MTVNVTSIIKRFLSRNRNLEVDQAIIRLAIELAFVAWLGISRFRKTSYLHGILYIFVIFFFISLFMLLDAFKAPERRTTRLMFAVVADALMMFFALYIYGAQSILFLFAVFTVPVGFGLRFGLKYWLTSFVLNAISLLCLYRETIIFPDNIFFSGIFISYVFINLFAGSIIYKLSQTKEKLSRLARFDALTQLPNRRLFIELLQQIMRRSKRSENDVACFFIDLDGFKTINDEYGHHVGDRLLQKVAAVFRIHVRNTDIAARFSGDEFVIAAEYSKDYEPLMHMMEKILREIETIRECDGNSITISASVGAAFFERSNEMDFLPDKLIRAADHAMYIAKNTGKGKIVIAR